MGIPSFSTLIKETVQTKNPAPIFPCAPFWNYAENLFHFLASFALQWVV
jgi:hypothetical protein